jgi:hypothetical protein
MIARAKGDCVIAAAFFYAVLHNVGPPGRRFVAGYFFVFADKTALHPKNCDYLTEHAST